MAFTIHVKFGEFYVFISYQLCNYDGIMDKTFL